MSKSKGTKRVIDAMTVWNAQKPQYNGFACGHGAHGDRKYNRNKAKREWQRERNL